MKSIPCFVILVALCTCPVLLVHSFVCLPSTHLPVGDCSKSSVVRRSGSSFNRLTLQATTPENTILECAAVQESDELKRQLLQLGASYDRGFGASPTARQQADNIIAALERCNPETYASRGINGSSNDSNSAGTSTITYSPLQGTWRMIWTSAVDVLFLEASPIFTIGAIHQVFEPPIVTNVIDLIPRVQSLFPPSIVPNTMFRVKVQTRGSERKQSNQPNRVGLVFEAVQFQPLQVLGRDTMKVLPPLGFQFPRLPSNLVESLSSSSSAPGFFDVTYLDQELLIIRQNDPGGLFALVKVDSLS